MKMFNVANFGEVTTTNDQVKKVIKENGDEGYVCRARSQTGGYGRQGRYWTSPEGGLYQSVLLRPKREISELPTLGLVMALSIRAALLRLAALPPDAIQVKWPNDLMAKDGKIAGISTEAKSGGVCVGMGVNVFKPSEFGMLLTDERYQPAFFEDIAIGYTEVGAIAFGNGYSFANKTDAIAAVGDAILSAFEQCYSVWQSNGFEPFMDEYRDCNYLLGKYVSMQLLNGNVIVQGTVIGVDGKAQLLVNDGTDVFAVNSGEAHILG